MSVEHWLQLDGFDEGTPLFRFECAHEPGGRWASLNPDGSWFGDECWFRSWWEGVGYELVDIDRPIFVCPIPVRPSDDWRYDEGGRIMFDDGGQL